MARTTSVSVLRIEKETDLAFLLAIDRDEEGFETDDVEEAATVWVPKSVVEDAEKYHEDDEGEVLEIASWWARDNLSDYGY